MKVHFGRFPKRKKNEDGEYIDAKERKMEIRVDRWDLWDASHTLSNIIVPVMEKFKAERYGSPFVDNEDVPEHLRDEKIYGEDGCSTGPNHTKKYDWVLDEIIWAFNETKKDGWDDQFYIGEADYIFTDDGVLTEGPNHTLVFDKEAAQKHCDRMENGRRLFAKYFTSFWL